LIKFVNKLIGIYTLNIYTTGKSDCSHTKRATIRDVQEENKYMTFRERAIKSLGIFPQKVPPEMKIEREQKFSDCTGYVISYNLEENERTRSILLKPESASAKTPAARQDNAPANAKSKISAAPHESLQTKLPAVLAIHQHNGEFHLGKAEPAAWDINGKIPQLNPMYAYGRDLVAKGYVALCPDLLCFEERFDPHFGKAQDTSAGASHEIFEFTKRVQHGSSLQAKYLHDMSVAIDILCSLDYVDTSRIGVIGHSLGGQTSLYTTWYDTRVKAGVSSCGFGTMETIINNKINHNKAMYIPGFSVYADTYDILCDIAPRAFAFTSGIKDDIFPIDGVRIIEEKAKKQYASLDAPDKLLTHIFNGGHSFDNEAKQKVYSFIDRELK